MLSRWAASLTAAGAMVAEAAYDAVGQGDGSIAGDRGQGDGSIVP